MSRELSTLLMSCLVSLSCGVSATRRAPTVGQVSTSVVIGSIVDSSGARPVHPSRAELVGSSLVGFGDSLGQFVLTLVPRGPHALRVKGIGFIERIVPIRADSDTVHLAPIHLWPNHRLDAIQAVPN